jgi:membrane protein
MQGAAADQRADRPMGFREAVSALSLRELAHGTVVAFREHQLLIAAAAIAFRVFLALVTGTLMTVGLAGFFGLEDAWRQDIAPDLRGSLSAPAYELINEAATTVLTSKQVYWVSLGALIAVWQISVVVRVSGHTLNRLYGAAEERSLLGELRSSVLVGVAIGVLMVLALVVVRVGALAGEELIGDSAVAGVISFLVRWALASALLLLVVGLIVRTGPGVERELRWVGFGSLLCVAGWVLTTILFGIYLREFADIGSVYGGLLTAFLSFEYLYVAAIVFLGGLVVDRLVQEKASGGRSLLQAGEER